MLESSALIEQFVFFLLPFGRLCKSESVGGGNGAPVEQCTVAVVRQTTWNPNVAAAAGREEIFPLTFSEPSRSDGAATYLREPMIRSLLSFFEKKGLAAIKEEDQREAWYDDWIAFQSAGQLYARLLAPREFSSLGSQFDTLRYTRFLEVCAYLSPAHGYSLQVTFLGLCAILMGDNASLKREAVESLEAGGLLAFGISEQPHGSDLLGNEFEVADLKTGGYVANGSKYYIGNSNFASMIAILARKAQGRDRVQSKRATPFLFAFRPEKAKGFQTARKIRTLGIRTAFVGEFDVHRHEFTESDKVAVGRQAWNAVFGTVALGKFFLGFGSIGICERAYGEAFAHLRDRVLYGKPAIDMPHIRATMAEAYARLTAMKLYAYRALDYVHAANATDRRYLLFAAVQKAKLSMEGVKVVALLSECIGARGFESDTYFETALRDIQLIPGLEGSTHINLGMIEQFMRRYFTDPAIGHASPGSLVAGDMASTENPFLMEARVGAVNDIGFSHFLQAYRPLMSVSNVRLFVRAAKAFQILVRTRNADRTARADTPMALATGRCFAIIAYAQLVAENATRLNIPAPNLGLIFHALVCDMNVAALHLASCAGSEPIRPTILRRLMSTPRMSGSDLAFVANQMNAAMDPQESPQ